MRRFIVSFLILSSLPLTTLYAQVDKKNDPNKINKKKSNNVIWTHVIDKTHTNNGNLIWKQVDTREELDLKRNNEKDGANLTLYEQIYNQYIELELFDLGRSVPIANTLSQGDFQLSFSQITPAQKAYYGGGTGNQNYSASFNYGLTDSLMIEAFYSHSDDPLHKKITKYDGHVANRWISYGTSLTWQFMNNNRLLVALNSSIENWNVKSGGCNLYNCNSTSNNIFTDKKEEVLNDNLVGSISLPIKYNITNKLDFHLVPRSIFLPSNQSNESGSGEFYGNSFGLGSGIEYKLLKNLKSYSSLYVPLSGSNSFDENLIFKKKTIYNAGLIYSLDTKISLEAGVTNGFGLSPSIGSLTLPSSDQLLYKTTLIYRPNNIELPRKKIYKQNRLRLGGLSVATAEPLSAGEIYGSYYLNNHGSWANKIVWGTSNRFNFDISFSSIGQNSYSGKPFKGKYHNVDELFVRGGGKATFLSQSDGDFITSSARVSAGRLRGWGWIFTESTNTYNFNDNLSFNFNPKVSFSGIASPAAIGTSLNWQILKDISFIPEYNFALHESTDNWTLALRITKIKYTNFDIYTTNSLNFIDTGQLQRSNSKSYGVNVGFIF
tara:strand:+ start:3424 stop:5238 length:1815 start_codon:yes stop_codon:yes gene_type:complete